MLGLGNQKPYKGPQCRVAETPPHVRPRVVKVCSHPRVSARICRGDVQPKPSRGPEEGGGGRVLKASGPLGPGSRKRLPDRVDGPSRGQAPLHKAVHQWFTSGHRECFRGESAPVRSPPVAHRTH